jgi:hypothetical protein
VDPLVVGDLMPRLGSREEFGIGGIKCEGSRLSIACDGGETQRGVTEDCAGVGDSMASCDVCGESPTRE